jgi:hypothetical protein
MRIRFYERLQQLEDPEKSGIAHFAEQRYRLAKVLARLDVLDTKEAVILENGSITVRDWVNVGHL